VQLGGKVLTFSDSEGFIHDPDGITQEKIDWVKATRPSAAAESPIMPRSSPAPNFTRASGPGASSATSPSPARPRTSSMERKPRPGPQRLQRGLGRRQHADRSRRRARLQEAEILYAPGKAANAGGVAVSGLEMSQNSARISWKEAELQQLLKDIMNGIHDVAPNMAAARAATTSIMSAAPTSPLSRKSQTRCWLTEWLTGRI
jgi:glutamate dehydrogenase (NADP+)